MYLGSTLNFLAMAIKQQSIAGLILTAFVYVVYIVYSVWLENPYTSWIYSEAARARVEKEEKAEAASKKKPASKSPRSPRQASTKSPRSPRKKKVD